MKARAADKPATFREKTDVAVVGAGAAGLMAAIQAARPGIRVWLLDGARTLGAKILVAGGGRCNVTHHHVDEKAFAGSTPAAIRKVLRRFDVEDTVRFFEGLGVRLKQEQTGKLFPTTDRARTVLDALLQAARDKGVILRHPFRVATVEPASEGLFRLRADAGEVMARRVIVATGGRSLPKTGSDGQGYTMMQTLGHTVTERIIPALVPLTLPRDHFLCALSGLTLPATVEVRAGSGKRLTAFTDSTLCTHFGLSGPSILDISRYYLHAQLDDPDAHLVMSWLPGETAESLERILQRLQTQTVGAALAERLPERMARALCAEAGVDAATRGHRLTRESRRALAEAVTALRLPIIGDRGFNYAEVTAGGVPLAELHLERMESRRQRGLYLAGEICDVDGRIGGFNFQWAWASGFVAGRSAAVLPGSGTGSDNNS
jgi:predicted Rossmann fold flavoprotein